MSDKQNNALRPFGMRDKIGYAMGDFGCNMSFSFISSYMITFFVIYSRNLKENLFKGSLQLFMFIWFLLNSKKVKKYGNV